MNNLIINGIDHSVFDLEWAKRGGVVFHTYDSGYSIFWSFFQGAVYGLAWHHPKIGYGMSPHEERYLDLATNQEYKMIADRMATPAECEAAGIEYIEHHGWRPIGTAPLDTLVIVETDKKKVGCAIFESRNESEHFGLGACAGKYQHWMPLPQPPKDE